MLFGTLISLDDGFLYFSREMLLNKVVQYYVTGLSGSSPAMDRRFRFKP